MALIRRNTAYSLNDIVNTKYGIELKCITAGTTSTDPLILTGASPITDGTVVWEIQEESGGSGLTKVEETKVVSNNILTIDHKVVFERIFKPIRTISKIYDGRSDAVSGNTIADNSAIFYVDNSGVTGKYSIFYSTDEMYPRLSTTVQDYIGYNDDYTIAFWGYTDAVYTMLNGGGYLGNITGTASSWQDGDFNLWYMREDSGNYGYRLVFHLNTGSNYNCDIMLGTNQYEVFDKFWHYFTITRQNGTTFVFYDGKLQQKLKLDPYMMVSPHNPNSYTIYLGNSRAIGQNNPVVLNNSYMTDLIFLGDIALWTADFTPPTYPLASTSGSLDYYPTTNYSFLDSSSTQTRYRIPSGTYKIIYYY